MDRTRANALKKREELTRELEEINRFLAMYEQFSDRTKPETGDTPSTQVRSRRATHKGRKKKLGPADFVEVMERIIRDEGRPMQRAELAEAIERRGLNIPSKDKPRYLGTILWRNNKVFVNIVGKGYFLVSLMTKEDINLQREFAEMASTGPGRDD